LNRYNTESVDDTNKKPKEEEVGKIDTYISPMIFGLEQDDEIDEFNTPIDLEEDLKPKKFLANVNDDELSAGSKNSKNSINKKLIDDVSTRK